MRHATASSIGAKAGMVVLQPMILPGFNVGATASSSGAKGP